MSPLTAILLALAGASVVMAALWVRQRRLNRADLVDVVWAFGVGVAAAFLVAVVSDGSPERRWLIGVTCGVWSLRLGWMLLKRVRALPEDGRYESMKMSFGARAWSRFFWFFQAQAAWVVLFALPAMLAAMRPGPLDAWDLLGVSLALIALAGETAADHQLHRFRVESSGTGGVCDQGLWRWSRHPNYFFEWFHWWSYVAFAAGWWPTLLGPAIMLVFLFRVTGIPWTERQALRSRGEAYRAYQRRTSIFIPWPTRRISKGTRP